MKYQLARFINPKFSVCGKLTWVEGAPEIWETKYSVNATGTISNGPQTQLGFATNVLGDDDGIPMVAFWADLELLGAFAEKVRQITFHDWISLSEYTVRELAE